MARYAVIKDGKVINTCVWDGVTEWTPPEGTTVVEIKEGVNAGPDYTYANGVFIAPIIIDEISQ